MVSVVFEQARFKSVGQGVQGARVRRNGDHMPVRFRSNGSRQPAPSARPSLEPLEPRSLLSVNPIAAVAGNETLPQAQLLGVLSPQNQIEVTGAIGNGRPDPPTLIGLDSA